MRSVFRVLAFGVLLSLVNWGCSGNKSDGSDKVGNPGGKPKIALTTVAAHLYLLQSSADNFATALTAPRGSLPAMTTVSAVPDSSQVWAFHAEETAGQLPSFYIYNQLGVYLSHTADPDGHVHLTTSNAPNADCKWIMCPTNNPIRAGWAFLAASPIGGNTYALSIDKVGGLRPQVGMFTWPSAGVVADYFDWTTTIFP